MPLSDAEREALEDLDHDRAAQDLGTAAERKLTEPVPVAERDELIAKMHAAGAKSRQEWLDKLATFGALALELGGKVAKA